MLNNSDYKAAAALIRKLPKDRLTLDLADHMISRFQLASREPFDQDAFLAACGIQFHRAARPRFLPPDYPPDPIDPRD